MFETYLQAMKVSNNSKAKGGSGLLSRKI